MPRHRAEQDIDVGELEKLALLHCTQAECAAFFGVTEETMCRVLKRTAAHRDAYQRGLQRGKLSIRRKQYELAMAGDKTMLIWLGKQLLGQKDRHDMTTDNKSIAATVAAFTPAQASAMIREAYAKRNAKP